MNCINCSSSYLNKEEESKVSVIDFEDLITFLPPKVRNLIIYKQQDEEGYDLDVIIDEDLY